MHRHDHERWQHSHEFDQGNPAAERSTRRVVWITALAMIAEVAGGWWFNSMALLADGWHMGSHALAIGLSMLAYVAARRWSDDRRFAFGTWKIEVLGSFASAVLLVGVALLMLFGSVERLLEPQPIHYPEALVIAALGLLVNLLCAGILGHAHGPGHEHHGHGHGHHDHDHGPHHGHGEDLNLRSAYIHVITDAATSVLAIVALFGGWRWGWRWLDPAMGIVGALLIVVWAKNLIVQSATILLDREMDHPVVDAIREQVESPTPDDDLRVIDLHVWRVGRRAFACALTVVTHDQALTAGDVRRRIEQLPLVGHATVEMHYCRD